MTWFVCFLYGTFEIDYSAVTDNGQAVWTLIKRNIFKHRSQKHQDADEVGLNKHTFTEIFVQLWQRWCN